MEKQIEFDRLIVGVNNDNKKIWFHVFDESGNQIIVSISVEDSKKVSEFIIDNI